jgi:glycosyltransferase involved in cell wall biosynthesis
MPLSLIQAGMAGIPVVATNVGSVGEVVIDGKTGFLTGLVIKNMADSLESLEKNKNIRTEFGENAQKYTAEKFSTPRLVSDHEKLYMDLLSQNHKAKIVNRLLMARWQQTRQNP